MAESKYVFFATDVHGSNKCFKKFINAGKFYKVNTLILGGDLTGKMIIPLIQQPNGDYHSFFMSTEHVIKPMEVDATEKMLTDSGAYAYRTTSNEYKELQLDEKKRMRLFRDFMIQRLKEWLVLAEERLKGTGISIYITGGNDDPIEIEDVLASSSYVVAAEGKVLDIGGGYEMLSSGYCNVTPWNCPRDVPDEIVGQKIEAMIPKVKNMNKCIFNLHAPPYDTPLDKAARLDENLRPVLVTGGEYEMIPVGSKAVRNAIERYQPLLGLHGHIHESRAATKLNKTLCINPGSEYGEGILRGVVISLNDKKGIENYSFTSG